MTRFRGEIFGSKKVLVEFKTKLHFTIAELNFSRIWMKTIPLYFVPRYLDQNLSLLNHDFFFSLGAIKIEFLICSATIGLKKKIIFLDLWRLG